MIATEDRPDAIGGQSDTTTHLDVNTNGLHVEVPDLSGLSDRDHEWQLSELLFGHVSKEFGFDDGGFITVNPSWDYDKIDASYVVAFGDLTRVYGTAFEEIDGTVSFGLDVGGFASALSDGVLIIDFDGKQTLSMPDIAIYDVPPLAIIDRIFNYGVASTGYESLVVDDKISAANFALVLSEVFENADNAALSDGMNSFFDMRSGSSFSLMLSDGDALELFDMDLLVISPASNGSSGFELTANFEDADLNIDLGDDPD